MAINRFFTLNKMQKSLRVMDTACFSVSKTWELTVKHTQDGYSRVRTVAFITKSAEGYHVTLTGKTYQSFMAALASLLNTYVSELLSLVASFMGGVHNNNYQEINKVAHAQLNPVPAFDVPAIPTYDRGAKKEYLHPLRRAVTRLFGGVYHR